jgi:hypothetical protein
MTIVDSSRPITGGVDTHLDNHVAAALDANGGLCRVTFPRRRRFVAAATTAGPAAPRSGSREPARMARASRVSSNRVGWS